MQAKLSHEITSPHPPEPAIIHGLAKQRQVEFTLDAPQAQAVFVAGEFNHWDPRRTPLKRTPQGSWKTSLSLAPGRHQYRFIVDGRWQSDPKAKESAANPFGTQNSVAVV